jgi:hypothetical protein
LAPKVALHLVMASIILWLPTRKLLAAAGVMTVLYVAMVIHNFSLAADPRFGGRETSARSAYHRLRPFAQGASSVQTG